MNPIKNKKNLESLVDEIRNIAYTYVEKYSPSKQQLKTYLFKRLIKKGQKTTSKKEIFDLIDSVLQTLIDQKFLSDKYYSQTKSNSYYKKFILTCTYFTYLLLLLLLFILVEPLSCPAISIKFIVFIPIQTLKNACDLEDCLFISVLFCVRKSCIVLIL